jgi:hypothetical protein
MLALCSFVERQWTVESHWLDAKVYGLVLEPTGIEKYEFRRRGMFSHLSHAASSFLWETDEEGLEFESFNKTVQWSFLILTSPYKLNKKKGKEIRVAVLRR